MQDSEAKLPGALRGYSHDMGPRNEVNAKTVNWNSDGGDKEDELNKYRISSGDNLFLPTRGVADV